MKRSVGFWSPPPVSPVRPFLVASLVLAGPGCGRPRRSPIGPVVVASPLTFGFSPNRPGVGANCDMDGSSKSFEEVRTLAATHA